MEHCVAVCAEGGCGGREVLGGARGHIVAAGSVIWAFLIFRVDALPVNIDLHSRVHTRCSGVLDISHKQSQGVGTGVSVQGTGGLDDKFCGFGWVDCSVAEEQHTHDS